MPDVLLVFLDLFLLLFSSGGVEQMVRSVRTLRLVRMDKLLKIGKLSHTIEEICEVHSKQGIVLVMAIVNTFICIIFSTHVLACGWSFIGIQSSDKWWQSTL